VLAKGRTLHLAAELFVIRTWDDARRLEETWLVGDIMTAQSPADLAWLADWDRASSISARSRS
jgi:hypothetical protein